MLSLWIAGIAFVCVFGGALLGLFLRTRLPEGHLGAQTHDVVKLGVALIATMAALVLGLLIASAKSNYDTRSNQLLQVSANIILLDRVLALYGPETAEARARLQRSVTAVMAQFWPAAGMLPKPIDRKTSSIEMVYDSIQQLSPRNDAQRLSQTQALTVALDLGRTRVLLFQQLGSTIPVPFLVVLVFWLFIIFGSFGLFAPKNGTVIAAFFVCALSVSGAIFLILELDRSFEGLIQISGAPLRDALAQIGD
jgi:hypothetical protein